MGVRDLSGRDRAQSHTVIARGPVVTERVRWSDVDSMEIVYYGSYLRFIEAAEDEFFRGIGFPYTTIAEELGVWLARIHVDLDYVAPARLGDDVTCRAELLKIGGSSLTFAFPIERIDGTRLAAGGLVLAALDRQTLRPVRLPPLLRDAMLRG